MKKYYIQNNDKEEGPFSLEELKNKNLKNDSPIWHQGLVKWTVAGELNELKDIIVSTPPSIY